MPEKSETQKEPGNPPKYRGDGVAVWLNQTKDNKPYLTIQLLGKNGIRVNAFLNEKKE